MAAAYDAWRIEHSHHQQLASRNPKRRAVDEEQHDPGDGETSEHAKLRELKRRESAFDDDLRHAPVRAEQQRGKSREEVAH